MRWCKQKFEALAVLLAGSLVLLAAWTLPPGSDGWGKDGRWRLPPCTFRLLTGWLTGRELPCATCGFTHAFSYAAHGRFAEAFREQPAGALLFAGLLGLMARAAQRLWRPEPPVAGGRRTWLLAGAFGVLLLGVWICRLAAVLCS